MREYWKKEHKFSSRCPLKNIQNVQNSKKPALVWWLIKNMMIPGKIFYFLWKKNHNFSSCCPLSNILKRLNEILKNFGDYSSDSPSDNQFLTILWKRLFNLQKQNLNFSSVCPLKIPQKDLKKILKKSVDSSDSEIVLLNFTVITPAFLRYSE